MPPGGSRERLARTLSAAFAEGLLSEHTLSQRLGVLFGAPLIDPQGLVGDLSLRTRRRRPLLAALTAAAAALQRRVTSVARASVAARPPLLLALDWTGRVQELIAGRASDCDVVLGDRSVSRRHAHLLFRDGGWILVDLDSTNGTTLNGVPIGRSRLHPGDRVLLGAQPVDID